MFVLVSMTTSDQVSTIVESGVTKTVTYTVTVPCPTITLPGGEGPQQTQPGQQTQPDQQTKPGQQTQPGGQPSQGGNAPQGVTAVTIPCVAEGCQSPSSVVTVPISEGGSIAPGR